MSYFVNLRAGPFGSVCSAYVIEGPVAPAAADARSVPWAEVPLLVLDRQVFLITHGFNVSFAEGMRSLARLDASLGTAPDEIFLGVLWPGDWIVPGPNYPFEGSVAMKAGDMLADFCNTSLAGARSLSFASHSLGVRLMLRAIQKIRRRVRHACFAAGAINDDCLSREFAAAAANCDEIRTLSSAEDRVLEYAYPVGDLLGTLLLPDHRLLRRALGRRGPAIPYPAAVRPAQIGNDARYDHHDYLPPSAAQWTDADPNEKWRRPASFIASAMRGQTPTWP